jgi:hypothetical protein
MGSDGDEPIRLDEPFRLAMVRLLQVIEQLNDDFQAEVVDVSFDEQSSTATATIRIPVPTADESAQSSEDEAPPP